MKNYDFEYEKFVKQSPTLKPFVKADAPLLSSTTAAFNQVYGRAVWCWVNRTPSLWSALMKQTWENSGIRVITADPTWTAGIAEDATLADSVKPTYAYMKFPLRQMMTKFQYSRAQMILSKNDDSIATPQQLVKDAAEGHIAGLETLIQKNAETEAGGASAIYAGGGSNGYQPESIDRIISADAEEDDLGGTHNGWYNPWDGSSYDRDSGTTHDAVVVHGDGTLCYKTGNPAFGTDATLSLDALDTLYLNCRKNGLDPRNAFFYTGWDTYMRIKQLIDPKERFVDPTRVSFTVNGVRTERGAEAGMLVSSYYGIPIIVGAKCPTDTISKIYLIDQSSIFMRVATPPTLFDSEFPTSASVDAGATWTKKLNYESFWLTEGNLVATRFNTSGKLCALK